MMRDIIEACAATGLLIKKYPSVETKDKLISYQHAPISLFPTPYPLHIYKELLKVQEPVGCLVSNLVANPLLIHEILDQFLKYDPFLAKLVDLSKQYNKYALSEDES